MFNLGNEQKDPTEEMVERLVKPKIEEAMRVRDYDRVSKLTKHASTVQQSFQKAREKFLKMMMELQNSKTGGS